MFKNILIVIILYSAPIIFANQSYGQLSLQQIIPLVQKKTELEKFIFNRHSHKFDPVPRPKRQNCLSTWSYRTTYNDFNRSQKCRVSATHRNY